MYIYCLFTDYVVTKKIKTKVPSRNVCERGVEGVGPRHWLPEGPFPSPWLLVVVCLTLQAGARSGGGGGTPFPLPLGILPRPTCRRAPMITLRAGARSGGWWVVAWGPCRRS